MYLAPANVHEGEVVWDLIADTSGLLLGDCNYWIPILQAALRNLVWCCKLPFAKPVRNLPRVGVPCWDGCAIASIVSLDN